MLKNLQMREKIIILPRKNLPKCLMSADRLFEKGFSEIGRIRISEVEDAQKAILAAINDKS